MVFSVVPKNGIGAYKSLKHIRCNYEPELFNLDATYEEFIKIYNGAGLSKDLI